MRSTTKAKIDKAIRLQWLRRAGVAGGLALVVAGGLWFTGLDATVRNRSVKGVVASVTPANSLNMQALENSIGVAIRLDDGREAQLITVKAKDPKVGQAVEITEHIHGTGRSTFSWK